MHQCGSGCSSVEIVVDWQDRQTLVPLVLFMGTSARTAALALKGNRPMILHWTTLIIRTEGRGCNLEETFD